MDRLFYFPLEPLKARYTELLSRPDGWVEQVFNEKFNVKAFRPSMDDVPEALNITTGEVLDSINRPLWALEQTQMWLKEKYHGGCIYFDDFFHPGIEALPYSRTAYKAYAFCWAQSFDCFDFTRNMAYWMRPYEHMAMEILDGVFVANDMLKELMCAVNPDWGDKIHVVGLPFNSQDVRDQLQILGKEHFDVVYSSRLDNEKNPEFFIEVVKALPDVDFVFCTGHDKVRGTNQNVVNILNDDDLRPKNLTVRTKLSKSEYYGILHNSKVQFNCASQDWVSFTLLEALSFDCIPVYPMYRSFIETLYDFGNPYMYRMLDLDSATFFIRSALDESAFLPEGKDVLNYHDGTIERIAEFIKSA